MKLYLRTLGQFSLQDSGSEELTQFLPRLVLTYLLLEPGFVKHRELANLIWAGFHGSKEFRTIKRGETETTVNRSSESLSQAFAALTKATKIDDLFFRMQSDKLRLIRLNEVQSEIWCDAIAFESYVKAGQYSDALELYQGEFLKDFESSYKQEHFQHAHMLRDWIELKRENYQRLFNYAKLNLNLDVEGEIGESISYLEQDYLSLSTQTNAARQKRTEVYSLLKTQSKENPEFAHHIEDLLCSIVLLQEITNDLPLRDNLSVIQKALELEIQVLQESLLELRMSGWLDDEDKPTTPSIFKDWLRDHPSLRSEIIRKLASSTPPEKYQQSFALYHEAYQYLPSFGSEEDLNRASIAYTLKAKELISRGDYRLAIELLEQIREEQWNDQHSETDFNLAYAYERKGDYDKGLEIISNLPDTEDVASLKATLYFRTGKFEAAELILDKLEFRLDEDSWAYAQMINLKGNIALRQGDYENALMFFREAETCWAFIDHNRRTGELLNIAVTFDSWNNFKEAARAYEHAYQQALSTDASVFEKLRILYNWSVFLLESGQKEAALEKSALAEALEPLFNDQIPHSYIANSTLSMGISFLEEGNLVEARQFLEKAAKSAHDARNRELKGMAMAYLGEAEKAPQKMLLGIKRLEHNGFQDEALRLSKRYHDQFD